MQLWEDYHFMLVCDNVWAMCNEPHFAMPQRSNYAHVDLLASPQLIRILRAYKLLPSYGSPGKALHRLWLMSDFSLAELRAAICPLRAIVGEGRRKLHLQELFVSAEETMVFGGWEFKSMMWDLAWCGLRAMKKVINGEIERNHGSSIYGWTFFLRACSPCSDFLPALDELADNWHGGSLAASHVQDFHNIVQWLKVRLNLLGYRDIESYLCFMDSEIP
ncbi:hypothetical protein B0H16DRAFT_1028325 [Mycena metata]|uniref:Uncharacterized protein n=1 Tax=Mycena metata TaxID=1033252 RepID=A0AAD7IHJ8_9AGAR|nr:hypothetical protein B0H16DRAFT_1028325 [Mycena metata]